MASQRKQINAKGWLIVATIISAMIAFTKWRNQELQRNGIILNAKIKSYFRPAKSSMNFNYEFTYNGKIISGSSPAELYNMQIFIGKTFPVIYSPKSGNNNLLVLPADFKDFNMKFPDSLNWVKDFIK